jgi:hypothetical protein
MRIHQLMLVGIVACFGVAGCDTNDGPAEEMGESLDETAEDVGNAVEDACEEVREGIDDEDC